MFDGSDLCWVPDIPIDKTQSHRMRIARFGDGYEQRLLDGINSLETKWSVSWDMREATIVNDMMNYFAGLEGHAFDFRDPTDGIVYRVFCDEWHVAWGHRRRHLGQDNWYGSLSAEFRIANGITTGVPVS